MSDDDNVVHVQFRASLPLEGELKQKLVELDIVENVYDND